MKGQGRYRIHAVSELTGVPEATLRAWERRYNVPVPLRTASGYRLYSHLDVEQVRRMRELCATGMAPADASKMVAAPPDEAPAEIHEDPYATAAQRIVASTRRMDPAAIEADVRFAMAMGEAITVVDRVFCPAMAEVGRDWERGLISVGHEHLASEIVSMAVRDMLRLVGPARSIGEVVLACFAEEDHSLPLYAAAFRFVEWGYRPHALGARTPPAALGAAVKHLDPAFVGLSATISPSPHRARELISAYADVIGSRPWAVGGAAAEEMREAIEAKGGRVVHLGGFEGRELIGRMLTETRS